mgnify:CR=1 FL=1
MYGNASIDSAAGMPGMGWVGVTEIDDSRCRPNAASAVATSSPPCRRGAWHWTTLEPTLSTSASISTAPVVAGPMKDTVIDLRGCGADPRGSSPEEPRSRPLIAASSSAPVRPP